LADTFDLLSKSLGNRNCAIVREISKMFEEITFSTLEEGYTGVEKGEFVLLVKASDVVENSLNDLDVVDHVKYYLDMGHDKNTAIKLVAKDRGVKKNDIYKETLDLK
jgi:16S rRNA (cytidine1402-2'-O)-methyltransferase